MVEEQEVSHLLIDEFEDFYQKIQLGKKQQDRIESAISALSGYLQEQYDLDESDVFVQGSFRTQTAVRPAPSLKEEGEYDVDIVVLCANTDDSPDDALETLETALESNGNYKDKVEKDDPKIPCVRLRYADEDKARFHVDVVPAKTNEEGTIDVPRRGDGWETSNPIEYISWVEDQGERYRRTLMMLKRWRDESKAPVKSIVLQVITAECLSDSADDSINIAETLRSISDYINGLGQAPELHNPVFYEEILTSRWKDEDFLDFKEKIDEAADLAANALDEEEHDEAALLWQKVFGEDFKFQTDKEVSIGAAEAALGDTSHAQPLRVPFRPIQGVSVAIKGEFYKPWIKNVFRRGRGYVPIKTFELRRVLKSGETVPSKGHLDYFANVYGLKGKNYDIHWQVVNTGQEAQRADGLRGTFFSAKNSDRPKYNYEQTSYEGTHWIECFVIMDNVCVARSGRFYIRIKH